MLEMLTLNLLSMNEDALAHLLIYGDNTLTDNTNTFFLNSVIECTTSAKRFNGPLFYLDFIYFLFVIIFSFDHTR